MVYSIWWPCCGRIRPVTAAVNIFGCSEYLLVIGIFEILKKFWINHFDLCDYYANCVHSGFDFAIQQLHFWKWKFFSRNSSLKFLKISFKYLYLFKIRWHWSLLLSSVSFHPSYQKVFLATGFNILLQHQQHRQHQQRQQLPTSNFQLLINSINSICCNLLQHQSSALAFSICLWHSTRRGGEFFGLRWASPSRFLIRQILHQSER